MFGATYIVALILHQVIAALSAGSTARSFKALSPGMLPPLGIIFGLFVAFTAAQVWSDNDRANAAVNREASALRSVVVLASSFPGQPEARLRALVRSYIEETTSQEWPLMAESAATLTIIPPPLHQALRTTLALAPGNPGQEIAQREMTRALEDAFEARRQRVLVSSAQVNPTKWACLILQAFCALLAIAVVHSDNRMGIGDRSWKFCDRRGGIRSANSRPRPALHGRDRSITATVAAGHAGSQCGRRWMIQAGVPRRANSVAL
ncbi:DUF4239 domain-containing protein [Mesorhizobium abyssinicae]|uniref:bestrophin-like domain n=1 Tax=Mesorhizobium abyssinicae TaxID=1209958 RepID=UPI002A24AFD6|nr:DUF4239 domain-containing protein [Mesorhizobium abyssinicae]MDX8432601.1 DUF4239 domain-containing protein [Mesorhizobium abyssinicae]